MDGHLRERIDASAMTRFQWGTVLICITLNVLDGFDVLVMAFTANAVSGDWDLSGAQLGFLLSAGLFGMAAGAILLAPLGDVVGRRNLTLLSLVVAASGMLLSSAAQDAAQLGLLRVLTGLGVGAMLASANVISSESANRRWRGLAVSLNSTGYAVGATAGGLLAVLLVGQWGWRSVFLVGGLATAALVPVVLVRMPESLDHLLSRRPRNTLGRLNALLERFGQKPLEALPEPVAAEHAQAPVRQLLAPGTVRSTLLIWAAFFMVMYGFYFVTSWTPALLVEAGLSADEGVTGGTLLNLGGIFGAALLGVAAARFALRRVLVAYTLLAAVMLLVFVPSTGAPALAFVLGGAIGLFANGCVAGLYAIVPSSYSASVRATGVGWALGIGRIGAILSPLIAGGLLDAGWSSGRLYAVAAGAFVLGGVAVAALGGSGADLAGTRTGETREALPAAGGSGAF
ncbi:benzoate transport [Nocardiopsis arvandica]|uniref:Benzoate transport n=1 Tax=Nocardiopsis sinuspersici TaxID=501010 RepID=A0A7Y9X992_9ACTN|nr:MFS transporter [Nocardiopsis sinuspersici]NYH51577.1 benzoate transport [Nocardiopsis sinuspersici]